MKRKLVQILVVMIALTIFSCGGGKTAKINQLSDIQGKTVGMLSSGITNQGVEKMISSLIGGNAKEVIYFNRGSDVLSALLSGKIDAFPSHNFATKYLLGRNEKVKAIPVNGNIEGGAIMAVRSEDQQLKNDLDNAITLLKENGTLKTLEDQWITNLPTTNEPTNKEISKIDGAKTIYVGVSGDFPPLDYIASDGRPAGFNVALLSEIGKQLKVNFEFVSLEAQARFLALQSKKIDLIFCHFQSENTSYFDDLKSNNWISTKPYFTYKGGSFIVKI